MSERWWKVKNLRLIKARGKCEYCGYKFMKKDNIVGHHLLGREFQVRFNLEEVEFCRVRHSYCEAEAHKKLPNGNLPSEQIIFNTIRDE